MKRIGGRAGRALGLALVLLVVGAGMAYAAGAVATSSGGTIVGCASNKTGALRIVSNASQCLANEHEVDFAAPNPPQSVTVNCGAGQSINQALSSTANAPAVTITVQGTCQENVRIDRDNVTLVAAAPGDGVAAPDTNSAAVRVHGRFAQLNGLTLTGGFAGVSAGSGQVIADQLTISGGSIGVNATRGGNLTISGSTIHGGQIGAVVASNGGSITLDHSTVTGDGADNGDAINAQTGGTITLNSADISGARHGVIAYPGGSVEIDDSTVHDNQNGFFAFGGAINAHGGSVSGNSGFGATAYPGGYLDLADGIDVSHNQVGVSSSGGRILIQNGGIVENSSSDGVQASGASSVVVEDGTIQSNGGDGIHVMDNSVVDLNPNDVITGNTGGDVMCDSTPANPLLTGQTPSNISTNCRHA
jgi:hypothetical protein